MTAVLLLLNRGLVSEFLKHRNTFMLWFMLFVPLIITVITFLTVLADDRLNIVNPWRWFIIFNYRPYLHIFVFLQILFICHVNYIEHRNSTWKNLRVLPFPFRIVFLSKALFAYCVLNVNVLLFYLLVISSGYLLAFVRPELGFQDTSYWYEALIPSLKFVIASSCIMAIMYWVSHYFKSILVSVIIGLTGYVSGFALFLINSRRGYKGFPYSKWHPFNFPGYAFDSFGTGNHSINMEYVYYGFVGGVLVLLFHYVSSRNKNVL